MWAKGTRSPSEEDRSAVHQISRKVAGFSCDRERARDHPAAGVWRRRDLRSERTRVEGDRPPSRQRRRERAEVRRLMPMVSPLSGPARRSPAEPGISSAPPFIAEPAKGPASPRIVSRPPLINRPASAPTSPSTMIAPAASADADAVKPFAAALDDDRRRRRPMRTWNTSPTVTRSRVVCSSIALISERT